MFAMVNWCLAVVQGTIWSWVPSGFPSPAIRPMANGGGCPRYLRWNHGGPLGESWVAFLPRGWNRAYSGSGAAAHGCWRLGFWQEWTSTLGSHNIGYVMRANSSELTLRLVSQSSLATLPFWLQSSPVPRLPQRPGPPRRSEKWQTLG